VLRTFGGRIKKTDRQQINLSGLLGNNMRQTKKKQWQNQFKSVLRKALQGKK
jgi:hypothetical protein